MSTATDPPPAPPMTADTLLMHPGLARVDPITRVWSSHIPLANPDAYTSSSPMHRDIETMSAYGLTIQGVSDTLRSWLVRRRISAWETRRGLIDTVAKKIWLVDFICMLGRHCTLICLFHGTRRTIEPQEMEYAQNIKRLARDVYHCDAPVLAVKVYGEERVFSKEAKHPAEAQNTRRASV